MCVTVGAQSTIQESLYLLGQVERWFGTNGVIAIQLERGAPRTHERFPGSNERPRFLPRVVSHDPAIREFSKSKQMEPRFV
jgi:hypothetical protein